MMGGFATLDLLCPGLLGPLPLLPQPLPQAPALTRLLTRAVWQSRPEVNPEMALLGALGVAQEGDQDQPFGALCLLADASEYAAEGVWMCASPVHLRADRDQLLVFAGRGVEPDRDEAETLVESFNRHFRSDGLTLLAPTPGRWYLRVDRRPALRTQPLSCVLGRSMAAYLPSGLDASDWMRFQNEAQMLFHASPVNRERERQGRPVVSGIWVWGGGELPAPPPEVPALIVGSHPLTVGLARWLGARHQTLKQWQPGESTQSRRTLVYWDPPWAALTARDLVEWSRALATLDAILNVAELRLREGSLSSIGIDAIPGGYYRLRRAHLRRFWRRGGLDRCLLLDRCS
jgi:hypothetical protein